MAELFGFEIKRKTDVLPQTQEAPVSFVPKENEDGAVVVAEGGAYGTYVDLEGSIKTEAELVTKYRDMAQHAEVDMAIDDIVNDTIVNNPDEKTVQLNLDDIEYTDKIKKMIQVEFDNILELLYFNSLSYDVFRRWYVDGRLYYHIIIDEKNPNQGIQELRYIDPRKIRKIKEIKKKKIKANSNVTVTEDGAEYYIFNDKGFQKTAGNNTGYVSNSQQGLKIAKDSICHVTSGLLNVNGDLVVSHLHKAIKPLNQLRTMEDSLVIYRISRAPERRIFYIDVGNLPKMKAEQYLRDIMTRFKNRLVYDSSTGEVRDDRKFMTMLEDFWLPRREGGKGTEITTLPGGQNLGQIEDIVYFQQKLYKSLNVPVSRLDPSQVYTIGRATEITRDEVKFGKFIQRLRVKFSALFMKLLERQLILKGVITSEDWPHMKENVRFKFADDNHFAELRETEVLRDRLSMLRDIDDYAGKYYSHEWIRKNVLHQSDEDIEEMDEQINQEAENPQYAPPLNDQGMPDLVAPSETKN